MKKFTVSFFVITTFIIYALYQNTSGVNSANIAAPAGSTANPLTVATISENSPTPTPILPTDTPTPPETPIPTESPTPSPITKPTASQTPPPPTPTTKPTPTAKPTPVPTPIATPTPKGQYTNGSYTGSPADAYYGTIQVKAVISGGKLTDVVFLNYPNDRGNSIAINRQAMPYLKQEAIVAQNANVDIISGATDTSLAFQQSLASALSKAKG